RVAGANVEKAVRPRRRREMQRHRHAIFDVEEIALLLAVLVFLAVAFEQLDDALALDLRETFVNQRAHVTLVILVRTKDVKIFQPADSGEKSRALGVLIKQVLG